MSLIGALNAASTGLAVSQTQIQTISNNIANINTPGYAREIGIQSELPQHEIAPGIKVGTGVELTGVQRQIDQALQARLNGATSDSSAADTLQNSLGQLQGVFDALSGNDISAKLDQFFGAWSNLANTPQNAGLRQVVLQDGDTLAKQFQTVSSQLVNLQGTSVDQFESLTRQADALSQQIAGYNVQIALSGGGAASGLIGQRDQAISDLSKLVNVQTVPQDNGSVNVYIGSDPLVLAGQSRGIAIKRQTVNGLLTSSLTFKSDGGSVLATGGELGGLASVQSQVGDSLNKINGLAKTLINEVNKIHGSGQGTAGFDSVTSTNSAASTNVSLNNPATRLKYTANTGSFVVHVKQKGSGLETSTLVQVKLDGTVGDTSLSSLAGSLGTIGGVSTSVVNGKITIKSSNPDAQISFSQDSSGVLAALGINNYFTGDNANNIGVNQTLIAQPNLLAAAQNGEPADNQTAIAIAALSSKQLLALNGQTLNQSYQAVVNGVGNSANAAKNNSEAAKSVVNTLTTQQQALSGVSLDEETINLMKQQRAYQGAAKLISTVDSLMQSLLQAF